MENLELKAKLYTKISAVMSESSWIEKDGVVDMPGSKYSYTTEAAFIAEIRPLMIKHKLVLIPVNVVYDTTQVTRGEKITFATTMLVSYQICDTETGYSEIVQMAASGNDSSDKHIAKSSTMALKYTLRQLYLLPTGDDPERTTEDDEPTSSTPPIALAASKYKEITGSPFTKDMLQQLSKAGYVTTNGFGVEENNTAKTIVKIANGVKSGKKFEELIVAK